jgi:membrane peptidoglycan carboxypeptidase
MSQWLADGGVFPIYRPKSQAGLLIADRRGDPLHVSRSPRWVYERFEDIPPLVVQSLRFIENRELMLGSATRNPSIEYARLFRALLDLGVGALDSHHPVSGGSTLATQLEKIRHSPEGRTESVLEKGRQIVSASLRAYAHGSDTTEARRQIVRGYLNALPLGAIAGHGEVIGLADG